MKRILLSLISIAAVSGLVFGVSRAFFSDTETSTGNTFQAGAIDLKVDYKSTYNGATSTSWDLKDLTSAEKFFNIADVKPGDKGEGTISLHVYNNDAWGCVSIIPTLNDDVSSTEPELEVTGETANTDSIYDGELAQNMQFRIWADVCATGSATAGDNVYTAGCDTLLTEGTGPLTPTTWALADSTHSNVFTGLANNPLVGLQDYYLGVAWGVPDAVGNIIQTDKYMADISFTAVQSRNNLTFVCPPTVSPTDHQLVLENETPVVGGPWLIKSDNIGGLLTWTGDGKTFNYTLTAQGLPANTAYSLIYYADGWPGNHPGALIGSHTTTASGTLNVNGNPDLGMDLPALADGNYAIGAKIWLIPSSAYDSGTKSVTAWPPDDTWLFEGNVYIHYDDTDI